MKATPHTPVLQYECLHICTLDDEAITDHARMYIDLDGNYFHNQNEADEYWRGCDFLETLTREEQA